MESSSDGEEMHPLTAADAVPWEIRSARRNATLALVVSVLMCLSSVVVFMQKWSTGAPASVMPPSAVVGLSEAPPSMQSFTDEIHGLAQEAQQVKYGIRPTPYHLKTASALRLDASAKAPVQRALPAGLQVFVLASHDGWAQVLVPSSEQEGVRLNATFGWLPEKEGGSTLLVKDSKVVHRRSSRREGPPPTNAEVAKKWDEVRAKQATLKVQLSKLQLSVGDSYFAKVREQNVRSASAARSGVSKVINVNELSKTVKDLQDGLQKQLTAKSPNNLLAELGHALSE